MDNIQSAKQESYQRIHDFIVVPATATILNAIDGFTDEVTAFEAGRTEINKALLAQGVVTGGATLDVDIAKSKMAEVTVSFGLQGAVKAKKLGNNDLSENLWHFKDYIMKPGKAEAIKRASEIKDLLSNNLGTLTNITAGNVLTIKSAIDAYQAIEEKPQEIISHSQQQGTKALPSLFKAVDDCVDNMYALIYGALLITNRTMVNEFADLKKLAVLGVRHTGLIVFIIDKATPDNALQGISIEIVEMNRKATSDIQGTASIAKFKPGTYHVKIKGTGWKPLDLILTFARGHMLGLDVALAADGSPENSGVIRQQ